MSPPPDPPWWHAIKGIDKNAASFRDALLADERCLEEISTKILRLWEHEGEVRGALAMLRLFDAAEHEQRRKGGAARGRQQAAEATADWAPWQDRFHALIDAGMPQGKARSVVRKEMERAGKLVANSTLRKRLTK